MKLFRYDGRTESVSFKIDDGTENYVINIYPEVTYQTMEGFGGALTDAAGYVFSQMNTEQQDQILDMYFSGDKMNYRAVRIHMDSCDFSTHVYSAVTKETDTGLNSFSFKDTEQYILPLLDAAQKKAGKNLKIMLSPWSPPAFMKTNRCRKKGGSLRTEYRERWAEYICRYIKEFKRRGYDVNRISIQNEPKAVQEWDSCVYSAKEEKEFLEEYLYPVLIQNDLKDIEVFIWDHNKERLFERAQDVIDKNTDSMIAGLAFHWYSGDHFEALDMVKKLYPDKKLILSESCLEFCKFDKMMEKENARRLAHDMIGNLNHGMEAFYDWNILLNEKGGPNHVENYCDAPYLFNEKEKVLTERRILRYYWHFSHFIRPGAKRLGTTRYTSGLEVTAWKNEDDSIVIVFLNITEGRLPCVLRINGKMTLFYIEPGEIISGVIKKEEMI